MTSDEVDRAAREYLHQAFGVEPVLTLANLQRGRDMMNSYLLWGMGGYKLLAELATISPDPEVRALAPKLALVHEVLRNAFKSLPEIDDDPAVGG